MVGLRENLEPILSALVRAEALCEERVGPPPHTCSHRFWKVPESSGSRTLGAQLSPSGVWWGS